MAYVVVARTLAPEAVDARAGNLLKSIARTPSVGAILNFIACTKLSFASIYVLVSCRDFAKPKEGKPIAMGVISVNGTRFDFCSETRVGIC